MVDESQNVIWMLKVSMLPDVVVWILKRAEMLKSRSDLKGSNKAPETGTIIMLWKGKVPSCLNFHLLLFPTT